MGDPSATGSADYRQRAQRHVEEVARAARAAHARMMRGDLAVLHVYYQTARIEAFAEGEVPAGAGWRLAFPERVPGDRTADQLVQWLAARADRVPYLGVPQPPPTAVGSRGTPGTDGRRDRRRRR